MVSLILEGRHRGCGFQYSTLFSSDADDNLWFEGSESSPLEAMRRILEVSWDVDTTEGANEVYSALLEAFSVTGDESRIYMVELLAPSYDVTQGERMYDEVMGVDFCISLAKCLKGRSEIRVRDHKTLSTVERVLCARERLDEVDRSTEDDEDNFDDDDDDDDEEEEEEDKDDTIDDKSLDSSSEEVTLDEDVDSFRQRLLLGWDDSNTKMEKRHLDTSPFPSERIHFTPGNFESYSYISE